MGEVCYSITFAPFCRTDRRMQGRHVFQPQAETVIILESFVAQDHFLRRVHRVLDLSFLQELTAPCYAEGIGRPSIDAEVFFRLLLVAHLYSWRCWTMIRKFLFTRVETAVQ